MARQRRIMKVTQQHGPQNGRDNPPASFGPLGEEANQILVEAKIIYHWQTCQNLPL